MTRTRVAPGIYKDATGLSAEVAVRTRPHLRRKGKRFPAGTQIRDIKRWQERTRVELRGGDDLPERGTLAQDVARYPGARQAPGQNTGTVLGTAGPAYRVVVHDEHLSTRDL